MMLSISISQFGRTQTMTWSTFLKNLVGWHDGKKHETPATKMFSGYKFKHTIAIIISATLHYWMPVMLVETENFFNIALV